MSCETILLADIGATFARFALSRDDCLTSVRVYKCDDYSTPIEAINDYLIRHDIDEIHRICFAVAGPVLENIVHITNSHWVLDREEIKKIFKASSVVFLNDFSAIAYSIPMLTDQQIIKINKDCVVNKLECDLSYLILGPGSGLGVSVLLKRDNKLTALSTEAGHISFSPNNELQTSILKMLKQKYCQVTNEHMLSGPGIINIYESLSDIFGNEKKNLSPQKICEAAIRLDDEVCVKTIDLFFEILGQVAGDLALAYNAFNGIFIAGGIVRRYPKVLINSQFSTSMANKNCHHDLLANIPLYLIVEEYPGIIGMDYFQKTYSL